MERAALADSALHRAARADPASRDTSAMEPQVEDPVEGLGEGAVDGSRANDSTTRAADSLGNPPVTSWTLPADAISTGVDSGVMAMLEQVAWDAAVMPVSTETDAAVMPIAMAFLDGDWHRYAR